jgi:NADH-quinone oxidoreductase subunit F
MTTLLLDCPSSPDLASYVAGGGGAALARARDGGPEGVLSELEAANLRGRGGAAFPTATKWRSVMAHADETASDVHVVVNAAEGEPGTAKDRTLLRHDPYRVLEGLLVAMATTGAVAGWVGIKERFAETERVIAARDEMVTAGWMAADTVRVVAGPDDYLFGEESALLEVIEGSGPLPRLLKPYDRGLFADEDGTAPNPTVVNNVETFAHVVRILEQGAAAFRSHGTDGHPGTIIATITGDVAYPCVVEVGTDTTLRELLSIAGADTVKIIASGVSVPLLTPAHLDLPLDADIMRTADAGLGSAGFVVYDKDRSAAAVIAALARFLSDSSCGQCTSCTSGTAAITNILERLVAGDADSNAVDALIAAAERADDAARCFLPTGARWVILSAVQRFGDDLRDAVASGVRDTRPYPVPVVDLAPDGTPIIRTT